MNDESAARQLGQNPGNDPQKDGERIGAAMTPSNAARDDVERIDEILNMSFDKHYPDGSIGESRRAEAKAAIAALIGEARETKPLDFTIDTDENGDYIRFFENGKQRIYGDKAIIRFLYDRLLELSAEKEVK